MAVPHGSTLIEQRYHVAGTGPVCIAHPGGPGIGWDCADGHANGRRDVGGRVALRLGTLARRDVGGDDLGLVAEQQQDADGHALGGHGLPRPPPEGGGLRGMVGVVVTA
ncbi:hypothetical protein ABT167_39370 [Streptomyces sp. NPDC001792]|uniref:hypothetical protein n=1 Tax=Streptomyces sp. NPDC001792 TaxID=3154524 RepID=UPI003319942B